jgi:site-specific recombinase XerD
MPSSGNHLLANSRTASEVEVIDGDVFDDLHAIEIFLGSYQRKSVHTLRAYTTETRRFLLWLKSCKTDSPTLLPLVSVEDANRYLDFLQNPRPFNPDFLKKYGWTHQPFKVALNKESMKRTITVLHAFFEAARNLRGAGNEPYCKFNPMVSAYKGMSTSSKSELEEYLTTEELNAVFAAIEDLPKENDRDLAHYHRVRWILNLLRYSYLRRSEAVNLKMSNFESSTDGWNIRIRSGKGDKDALIICPEVLLNELKIYRQSLGLAPYPVYGDDRPAIVAIIGDESQHMSVDAIYAICKVIFQLAADKMESVDPRAASRLRQASPHWMRHTGISHEMERGVNPRYVQAQARHSSLTTTAKYDHKDRKNWRRELEEK